MEDARNGGARKLPQNPIIGKARADKWDTQIAGLVTDLDINTTETMATRSDVKSIARWNFVRDIIIILLLVAILGLVTWRGILTDQRLAGCGDSGSVSISIPDKQ